MIGLPKSLGTIGAGNMAGALLQGLLRAGLAPEQLCASDPDPERRRILREELGIHTTESNAEVAERSEVVVLAVKPQQLERAAHSLPRDGGPLYISIVAGATTAVLRRLLGAGARIVRTMPNTPALVGAGVTAVANDAGAEPADVERARAILRAIGEVVEVPEAALDAVTGLSGSGPAYVFLLIEGLTEAGVREGLHTEIARTLALQTVLGAARLAQETGEHPAILRERVTSPGGTTSAGLAALESGGFRAALLAAVRAATQRSRELGKA